MFVVTMEFGGILPRFRSSIDLARIIEGD